MNQEAATANRRIQWLGLAERCVLDRWGGLSQSTQKRSTKIFFVKVDGDCSELDAFLLRGLEPDCHIQHSGRVIAAVLQVVVGRVKPQKNAERFEKR